MLGRSRDLEMWVRGHSSSLKTAPFERLRTVFYSSSIVNMRYFVSFSRYSDLLVENRKIFIPHLYLAPQKGNFGILRSCLILMKLDLLGYRVMKKTRNMLSRFHTIPERNGRTDRQNCYINISRRRADAR